MDELVAFVAGKSWALQFFGPPDKTWGGPLAARVVSWAEADCEEGGLCVAFTTGFERDDDDARHGVLLTLGYACTLLTLMPLSFLNLDDNVLFQLFSFFALIVLCAFFAAAFVAESWSPADDDRPGLLSGRAVSAFAEGSGAADAYASVVGVVLFNYALAVSLPSWLNEKKASVQPARVVWGSISTVTVAMMVRRPPRLPPRARLTSARPRTRRGRR